MGITVKPQFDFSRPTILDTSLLGIVLGNVAAIVVALVQDWNVGELMWVYWGQSVVIGVTNIVRMLGLKEFTTKGMTMNGSPVPETPAAKVQVASFFATHYGFFHAMYAMFLWQRMALNTVPTRDVVFLVFCVAGFVLSHGFSLRHNRGTDFRHKKPNLGTLMFYPYMRVLPMHIAVMFTPSVGDAGLLLFLGLKTLADAGMHMVEHSLFRGPAEGAGQPTPD